MSNLESPAFDAIDPDSRRDPGVGYAPKLSWPIVARDDKCLVVYLDLNHWIYLAQAMHGHKQGAKYRDVLTLCKRAKDAGRAIFPLSLVHHLEMLNIADPAQRRDIATVMERLSDFQSLPGRPQICKAEAAAAFDAILGTRQHVREVMPLLGRGIGWITVGEPLRLRVKSRESGADASALELAIGDLLRHWETESERRILAGPTDGEVPGLQQLGWNPAHLSAEYEKRAQYENDLAAHLVAELKWKRGRLRDVITGRELYTDLSGILHSAAESYGIDFHELLARRERARFIVRTMPSVEVAIEMRTAIHRAGNQNRVWQRNDIYDVDAMAIAVPYCDVVVTEKHACNTLTVANFPKRMKTRIIYRLSSLGEILDDL